MPDAAQETLPGSKHSEGLALISLVLQYRRAKGGNQMKKLCACVKED